MSLPSIDSLEITQESAAACLSAQGDRGPSIRLIDCREEDEFALCRIEDAELIPLSRFAEIAAARFADTSDTRPVIVYCHHGFRSLQAATFLRRLGVKKCWSLSGGIDVWSQIVDASIPRY